MGRPRLKVGDRVRIVGAWDKDGIPQTHHSGYIGWEDVITAVDNATAPFYYNLKNTPHDWSDRELELINEGDKMSKLNRIPKTLKRVLDADYKAFYKLGWINGDLELTDKGRGEILDFVLQNNKAELGKQARAEVKELEKEKK